jgi:site-specific DNA recombinase
MRLKRTADPVMLTCRLPSCPMAPPRRPAARSQAATLREQHQEELRAVGGGIGKAEAAIDRYLDAFEAGTLREQQCGRRIEALTAKLVELKTRQDELRDLLDTAHDPTPDPQELAELLERVRAAVRHGPLPVRKTLVDALVEEIRVRSRDHIVPVFRLPTAVAGLTARFAQGLVG